MAFGRPRERRPLEYESSYVGCGRDGTSFRIAVHPVSGRQGCLYGNRIGLAVGVSAYPCVCRLFEKHGSQGRPCVRCGGCPSQREDSVDNSACFEPICVPSEGPCCFGAVGVQTPGGAGAPSVTHLSTIFARGRGLVGVGSEDNWGSGPSEDTHEDSSGVTGAGEQDGVQLLVSTAMENSVGDGSFADWEDPMGDIAVLTPIVGAPHGRPEGIFHPPSRRHCVRRHVLPPLAPRGSDSSLRLGPTQLSERQVWSGDSSSEDEEDTDDESGVGPVLASGPSGCNQEEDNSVEVPGGDTGPILIDLTGETNDDQSVGALDLTADTDVEDLPYYPGGVIDLTGDTDDESLGPDPADHLELLEELARGNF